MHATTRTRAQLVNLDYARELLEETNLDAVIATSPSHIQLLGGYSTWLDEQLRTWMLRTDGASHYRAGFALLTREGTSVLAVSPLFFNEALNVATADRVIALPRTRSTVADEFTGLAEMLALVGLRDARIGVEFDGVSPAWRTELAAQLPAAHTVDASKLLRLIRSRKSDTAISRLREVAAITESALGVIRNEAPPYHEWRDRFRLELAKRGADFDHIVYGLGSGDLGQTLPVSHQRGAGLYVDGGARKNGFASDTGVTFATRWTEELEHRYGLAFEALHAGAEALQVGQPSSAVYAAMADVAAQSPGLRVQGHGIGLDIRELPLIGPARSLRITDGAIDLDGDLPIEPGQVINLEVAEFFDDGTSIQIERTFLIDGSRGRPLNTAAREAPWDYTHAS